MNLTTRGPRWKDALCLALLLAVEVLLCRNVLRGQVGLGPEAHVDNDALLGAPTTPIRGYSDLTPIVIEAPRDRWIADRVRSGHLDLWNPLQGTGVPLPPDQGGFFWPLRWLQVLIPGFLGYALFHCARLWIAAVGTFFFARHLGQSRPAALLAGVTFGFCGGMIAQLPFISCGPICTMPWVLLAQGELVRRRSAWRRALLGVTIAAALVAGHPSLAATVLLAAGVHALACLAASPDERWQSVLDLAAGWALGFAFAAPYLLPFAEYVLHGHSYKQLARGIEEHGVWREFTLATLGPGVGAPAVLDAIRDTAPGRTYPYILNFIAGTAAWVLGCVALLRRRVPSSMLLLGALGLVLSFEPAPFDHLLLHTPLLRDILPRYYWHFVMLPLACAAGAGADVIATGRESASRFLAAVALFLVLAFAAQGVSTFGVVRYPKVWPELLAALAEPRPDWTRYHVIVLGALALVAGLAGVMARRGAVALLLIVTTDLVYLMRPHLKDRPSAVLRHPMPAPVQQVASEAAAEHARMSATTAWITTAALPQLAGLADIRMTAPLIPDRYEDFLLAAGFDEPGTGSCCTFALPDARSPWAELAAVRFIEADAAGRRGIASDETIEEAAQLPRSTVFDNPHAFGRARLFFGATVAADRKDATAKLRALARGGEHVADTGLGKTVVLEAAGAVAPAPLAGEGSAEVRWLRDEPDEVVLEAEGAAPAYVMLADTYYPGWRATVDGAAATIFPADLGFRAVAVAPGKHTVRFSYRPASMWSGVAILVAALAAAAIGIWRGRSKAQDTW